MSELLDLMLSLDVGVIAVMLLCDPKSLSDRTASGFAFLLAFLTVVTVVIAVITFAEAVYARRLLSLGTDCIEGAITCLA